MNVILGDGMLLLVWLAPIWTKKNTQNVQTNRCGLRSLVRKYQRSEMRLVSLASVISLKDVINRITKKYLMTMEKIQKIRWKEAHTSVCKHRNISDVSRTCKFLLKTKTMICRHVCWWGTSELKRAVLRFQRTGNGWLRHSEVLICGFLCKGELQISNKHDRWDGTHDDLWYVVLKYCQQHARNRSWVMQSIKYREDKSHPLPKSILFNFYKSWKSSS